MFLPVVMLAMSLSSPLPPLPESPAIQGTLMAADEAGATCPVCGKPIISGAGVSVTVRGHQYTVDDQACANQLTANPDKFLNEDGTPKNSSKSEKGM